MALGQEQSALKGKKKEEAKNATLPEFRWKAATKAESYFTIANQLISTRSWQDMKHTGLVIYLIYNYL